MEILKKEQEHVQVRYVISGYTAWYTEVDFERMFEIVEA